MLARLTGSLVGVGLVAVGLTQSSSPIRLQFPSEGDREVWVGSLDAPGEVGPSLPVSGVSVTLPVSGRPPRGMVFVHDRATGNVAEKPLADVLRAGSWTVGRSDEKRVFRMDFRVVYGGKPVATAVVRARAGAETREALVTPADLGRATLSNLPAGKVEVTVRYKSSGETKTTPAQTFEAKLDLGPGEPKVISLPDPTETVAEPSPAADPAAGTAARPATPQDAPPAAPAPNPLASLLNLVLGLAVVGGIAYAIYRYVARNPDRVKDALKQVGLGDAGPGTAPEPAPEPMAPRPVQPIVLEAQSPAEPVVPAGGPIHSVKNPRLVAGDGSVHLLPEGTATIGREEGLEVALPSQDTVSRRHAQAERAGDTVTLTDLGSTNGTFVNGVRVTAPVVLLPGDSVQFGSVAFRFEV